MRYLVFARSEYDKPVSRQGVVEAEDADAASDAARERFGDALEVRLVPEESVQWIVGPLPDEKVPDGELQEVTA